MSRRLDQVIGTQTRLPIFANAILSEYSLGVVRECRYLSGGMFAKPLLVITDSGKYILRSHRFRDTESLFRFQADVLNLLAARGVRCPCVVPDRLGKMSQVHDSILWAVYEYLEGQKYSWTEWRQAKSNTEFLTKIGADIAGLHDVLATIKPTGDDSLSPSFPPIQFHCLPLIAKQWETDLARIERDAMAKAAPQARSVLLENASKISEHWRFLCEVAQNCSTSALELQLVHGDLSPVNMIFDTVDNGLGLIDWDCLHYGLRIYDALGDLLNRPPVEAAGSVDFNINEVRLYLEGYQRVASRRLTRIELGCAPALCLARQLEDLRQRVWVLDNVSRDSDAEYAALIRGRVRMLDCIRARAEELSVALEELY